MAFGRLGASFGKLGAGAGGGRAYSAQARAFFSRLSVQPTDTRKGQYNTLITSLVSAGVWAKLDALYMFAAADQATALTNLVSSSYGATAVNSPTFTTDQGFNGNGSTSYVNTNFNPATAGGQFSLNSAHFGIWDLTATPQVGVVQGGSYNGTQFSYVAFQSSGNATGSLNSSLFRSTAQSDTGGFQIVSRTDASTIALYKNGSQILTDAANTSQAIPSLSLFICGRNSSGSLNAPTTDRIGVALAGSGMTSADQLATYNALHTYLQAVAGVA